MGMNERNQVMNIQMNGVVNSTPNANRNRVNNYSMNVQNSMNNGLYGNQINNHSNMYNQRGYGNNPQINQQSRNDGMRNSYGMFSTQSQQGTTNQSYIRNSFNSVNANSEGEHTKVTIAGLEDDISNESNNDPFATNVSFGNTDTKKEYDPFESAVPLQQQIKEQENNSADVVGRTEDIKHNSFDSNLYAEPISLNQEQQKRTDYSRQELQNMNQSSLSNIASENNEVIEKNNMIQTILNQQIKMKEQEQEIERLRGMVTKDR